MGKDVAGHEDYVESRMAEEDKKEVMRQFDVQMRWAKGEDITRDEAIEMFDLDEAKLRKMKNGKSNYRLRKVLGKLTHAEMQKEAKEKVKMEKVNYGMDLIYALVDRGLKNVATK